MARFQATEPAGEGFQGLLLRHRGRTGLTQSELAALLGVHRRSIQAWESGLTYPSAASLQRLVAAYLQAGGFAAGREAAEAEALWGAAVGEAPRLRTPFDSASFAEVVAARAALRQPGASDPVHAVTGTVPDPSRTVARRQDWGEAPDVLGFHGRALELALLHRWICEERCRLVALLGMGGIGKTSLAARLAHDLAPAFERVYWRSLRNAPAPGEWLWGAIGFLSGQQLLPPEVKRRAWSCWWSCCGSGAACWSWTTWRPCSSRATVKGAIGKATPATPGFWSGWRRASIRAVWC